jgi:hypothetical protein
MPVRIALPLVVAVFLATVSLLESTAWGLQVNVREFGAVDGDQTLVDVDYWTGSNLHVRVTQQSKSGKAIQDAIDHLASKGGGTVYIPRGTWWVYGYINVPYPKIEIRGEGADTVLKSMPDAPCADGYGLLVLGYTEFAKRAQPPGGFVGMAVRDLKLDGNLYARGRPKAEYQIHNLNLYGVVVRAAISNVISVDAGCDCLNLRFGKQHPVPLAEDDCEVLIENCVFQGGFRQGASFCGSHNVTVRDTVFADAGKPFGGNTFTGARLRAVTGTAAFLGGGVPDVSLDAREGSSVLLYGRSFDDSQAKGRFNGGRLTGVWYDNTPLALDLVNHQRENTPAHLVLHTLPSRLEISGPPEIVPGIAARYTCTAWFSDNTSQDVSCGASWSTDLPGAEVHAGRLMAGPGMDGQVCRITAALAGKEASLEVAVRLRTRTPGGRCRGESGTVTRSGDG